MVEGILSSQAYHNFITCINSTIIIIYLEDNFCCTQTSCLLPLLFYLLLWLFWVFFFYLKLWFVYLAIRTRRHTCWQTQDLPLQQSFPILQWQVKYLYYFMVIADHASPLREADTKKAVNRFLWLSSKSTRHLMDTLILLANKYYGFAFRESDHLR